MSEWMRKLGSQIASVGKRQDRVPENIAERIPFSTIKEVTFFKRDELTTDLICCEVKAAGQIWFFHEEVEGWERLIDYLEQLPHFLSNWYASVAHPPFTTGPTVAYTR